MSSTTGVTKKEAERKKRAGAEAFKAKQEASNLRREKERQEKEKLEIEKEKGKESNTESKVGKDDDKIHYDPEDDVWALEEAKASPGRKYARSVMFAFRMLVFLSTYLGLFPLIIKRAKDGTYSCKFEWKSHSAILFICAASFVVGTTLWLGLAVLCITTNSPEADGNPFKNSDIFRSEEIYIYKRNTIFLVIIFASFIHLTICMVCIFLRREYIAKHIVYWTEVVELLQLDVGRNVTVKIFRHLAVLIIFAALLVTFYVLGICPQLSGSGSTFYLILTRVVDGAPQTHSGMSFRKQIFAFFIMYAVVAGYMYILWFFYFCRILTNILKIWNNRFQYCLHKQIIDSMSLQASKAIREGVKSANRTSRAHLFQDHLVIFNLLEGINKIFETIMESFYLTNMIMIIFETYGFVHQLFYDEYKKDQNGCRKWDIIPTFLFLVVQVYMFMIITLEAAAVADEARNVLHIVRRKGMMTSRLDNELWFMLSMRLSFSGHEDVGIIGAGFFYVTKSFLLGAVSAMASHFIIFYQFEVPYAQTEAADSNLPKLNIKNILIQMEGESLANKCVS